MTSCNRRSSDVDDGDLPQTRSHYATSRKQRSNESWVAHLSGTSGVNQQQDAHEDLSRYLFVVVFNYLQGRRHSLLGLVRYADDEIALLAQDFVQTFMEKLVKEEYTLLEKYSTVGSFTSWAAQVTLNLVSTEFRRARWSRQLPMIEENYLDQKTVQPETAAVRAQISDLIDGCLARLPEHYRVALVRCIAEDEKTADVAREMELTPNAVYILVHRAKAAMRSHLIQVGVSPQTLADYTE